MDSSSSERSYGLDALRAAACAMVVVFHLHVSGAVDFGRLVPVVANANSGVWIFFALSGYLLYRPFVRGKVNLVEFAIRRSARILPGYWAALVALTLLTRPWEPVAQPLAYLTLTETYSIPLRNFMAPAWTLAAEVAFYITLPLIARVARGRELPVLLWLAAFSMAGSLALLARLTPANEWLVASYPMVFFQFVPGMLLAWAEVKHPGIFRRLAGRPALAIGLGLIALGLLPSPSLIPVASAIGGAILIGWLLQHRIPGGSRWVFFGGMSYALYLWHLDLIQALGVPGLAIAVVGAACSWLLIERPVLRLAHRVTTNRIAIRVAAALQPAPAIV